MKKFLFYLLCMVASQLFSQTTYRTYKVETSVVSTSKMVRNYSEYKWDFIMSDKFDKFKCLWVFYISDENTGTITNGDVNYDILSYSQIDENMVKIKVYNLKVGREMDLVMMKKNEELTIAIYDYKERTGYYFLP